MPSVQKNRGLFPGGYNAGGDYTEDKIELGPPDEKKEAKTDTATESRKRKKH